ncbi:ejaculatory bulb-specific protein 3-like [Lycorma delicatula]|uniref:ejaculatory bulb-specific protein 3-like n=1 Tax=Lycorma delicatula TaxID=130591 RepID=UPI003F511A79
MRNVTFFLLIQGVFVLTLSRVVLCEEKNSSSSPSSPPPRSSKSFSLPSVSDDALERAIKDQRYFNRQFACLSGEGPCDQVGRRLKAVVPLVVRGLGCPKCTAKEEEQMKKVVLYVQRNYPDKWQKLIRKYGSR